MDGEHARRFAIAVPFQGEQIRFPLGQHDSPDQGVVEDDIGVEFELRQCRRTFGQRNLDRGLDIESASVLMGHVTTNTTERFYSCMKLEKAQQNLKQVWESSAVNGEHAQEEEF